MMIKLLFFLAVTIVAVHSQFSPNQGPAIPCAIDKNCVDALNDDKSKCFNGRCHCIGANNAYTTCSITPKSPIMAPKNRPTVPVTQGRSQGSCVTDQECTNIENSKCIGGSCKCDATMTMSADGSKCLNLARNADGGCTNDTDCSAIKESICVDKKCQCKEKTHLVGDKEHSACVPDKGQGEDCAPENEECYKQHDGKNILTCNSTTKKCECIESFKSDDGLCKTSGALKFMASFSIALVMLLIVISIS